MKCKWNTRLKIKKKQANNFKMLAFFIANFSQKWYNNLVKNIKILGVKNESIL